MKSKIQSFPSPLPKWLVGKESACNVGDSSSITGSRRSPGGGHSNPLQYSCLENPQGQRSLAGYGPWGHKKSDTTERLSTAQHPWLVVPASANVPASQFLLCFCIHIIRISWIKWQKQLLWAAINLI